jgi:sigma-B regulation protein RsbU (phosphoserine phosphatase)
VVLAPAAGARHVLLHAGGPVLGLLKDSTYEEGAVPIPAGILLVAYTDGLTEACKATGSDWGEAGLLAAIGRGRARSAGALADHLLADVTRFMVDEPQLDDMTVLVARRLERPL